ncbi:MAG: DUF3800 domain-containing protein [Candidatus Moraniibacteriota bacterium]
MKILFLDESGDHNLGIIDPKYPIFVLAGVVFDGDYYTQRVKEKILKFKKRLFNSEKIILHTADIYRNRNGFEELKEKRFRERFYSELNKLIDDLNFDIIAAVIHKSKHLDKYGVSAIDPYFLSLEFIIERFIFSLDDCQQTGRVVAESRGTQLDNQLELAWLNLKIKGTRFIEPSRLAEKVTEFTIIPKSQSVGGLEIADLIASPIGRKLMRKSSKEDWQVIKRKFRKNASGHIIGHGMIIFPK